MTDGPAGSRDIGHEIGYDGVPARELATRLGVPRCVTLGVTSSTLDVAHALGEAGAPGGTLVLADRQTAGRGRLGRRWESPAGAGVWLTLLERSVDVTAIGVLAIRVGLAAAPVLDELAPDPVRLKWPNDLHLRDGKLAGVLCEARWHGSSLGWVAVGMGVNVSSAAHEGAATLRPGVTRVAVLEALVPALRRAAALRAELTEAELDAYAARDMAVGRRCVAPVAGNVAGVARDGALLVLTDDGGTRRAHGGSLIFEEAR
ncbi:MAG TPA: biotin--[acetyl-CoA-carboxylase] ligase [Gemmatimonadales bacterium]